MLTAEERESADDVRRSERQEEVLDPFFPSMPEVCAR